MVETRIALSFIRTSGEHKLTLETIPPRPRVLKKEPSPHFNWRRVTKLQSDSSGADYLSGMKQHPQIDPNTWRALLVALVIIVLVIFGIWDFGPSIQPASTQAFAAHHSGIAAPIG